MPIKNYNIDYNNIELNEYYRSLLWEKDIDSKIDFIAKEVLSYGYNNKKADCTIEEMIAVSKFQFLETSLEKRFAYKFKMEEENENFKLDDNLINPENENAEYKIKEKEFLKNPVKVIKEYAIDEANKEIDDNDVEAVNWKNHCKEMVTKLTNIENTYVENEKNFQPRVTTLLVGRNRYIGQNIQTCDDILAKTKGGFFERLFRTTSREYTNFKNAFRAYNDISSPNYGNKEALRTATLAYIKHKVPTLKDDEEPDSRILENLTGTSLERTEVCLSVLSNLNYQEKMDNLCNNFINSKVNENEQKDFQKDISEAVDEKNIIKEQVDEMDNNIIKENEVKTI